VGWLADEPLGMGGKGVAQHHLAGGDDLPGATVVHVSGSEQADAGVVVGVVVPVEEASAEAAGVLDGAEPVGEGGVVLEVLNWLSE
jgi:hypothetical protein